MGKNTEGDREVGKRGIGKGKTGKRERGVMNGRLNMRP
jgi:hypothetical protein